MSSAIAVSRSLSSPGSPRYSSTVPNGGADLERERERREGAGLGCLVREPRPPGEGLRAAQVGHQDGFARPKGIQARALAEGELHVVELGDHVVGGVHELGVVRPTTHHDRRAVHRQEFGEPVGQVQGV